MILYCQQIGCAAPLELTSPSLGELTVAECPSCGCIYRKHGLTDDEFYAWLAFQPDDPVAA